MMSASNFPIKRPSNLPNNQAKPPLYKSSSRNETAIKEEPKSERSDSPSTIPKKKAKKKPACITVNTDNCKYDIVRDCCQKLGYRIVEDVEPCILFWIDTGASVERILGMQPYQKINHFPGMHEICRKDRLARNLNRLSRMFPKDANFFPKTWVLPAEWKDFVMNQRNAKKRQYYISKPDHGCQGKGIFLFKNPEQVLPLLPTLKGNANLIVQSYLHRPLLIDGYKFDLRVYVLVTSADPLRVFIYKDGLARFATEPYQEPNEGNVENVCMHLTNYAINKNSDNFVHDIEDGKGSKRSIRAVLKFLAATRGAANAESLWKRIGDVVIKTLLTVQPQLKRNLQACFPNSRKPELAPEAGTGEEGTKAKAPTLENMRSSQCFEILGFDIFVDHKLKPWVLEVNHSPSFTCDSTLDVKMKGGVICDTLKLLNLNSMVGKRFIAEEKAKAVGRLVGTYAASAAKRKNTEQGIPPIGPRSLTSAPPTLNKTLSDNSSLKPGTTESAGSSASSRSNEAPGPRQTSSAASAASDDSNKTDPMENLSAEAAQALSDYSAEFPPLEMEVLEQFEDANLGHFERIFPPKDIAKFAHFLLLKKEAANIFSETISTKRRREYLETQKKKQELQAQKLRNWRLKRQEKTRSMPQLADGSGRLMLHQRSRSAADLMDARREARANKCTCEAEKRQMNALHKKFEGKQSIKMNVECLNDRFSRSMAIQREFPSGNMDGFGDSLSRPYTLAKPTDKFGTMIKTSTFTKRASSSPEIPLNPAVSYPTRNTRAVVGKEAGMDASFTIGHATKAFCETHKGTGLGVDSSLARPAENFDSFELIQRMRAAFDSMQDHETLGLAGAGLDPRVSTTTRRPNGAARQAVINGRSDMCIPMQFLAPQGLD